MLWGDGRRNNNTSIRCYIFKKNYCRIAFKETRVGHNVFETDFICVKLKFNNKINMPKIQKYKLPFLHNFIGYEWDVVLNNKSANE